MAIRQKERVGASTRNVEAICSAGVRCEISTQDGHLIVTDEPEARGGTNTGASPLAHLTASLASCQVVQIVKVAAAMRFTHSRHQACAVIALELRQLESLQVRKRQLDPPRGGV